MTLSVLEKAHRSLAPTVQRTLFQKPRAITVVKPNLQLGTLRLSQTRGYHQSHPSQATGLDPVASPNHEALPVPSDIRRPSTHHVQGATAKRTASTTPSPLENQHGWNQADHPSMKFNASSTLGIDQVWSTNDEQKPYWRKIARWANVTYGDFLSHRWQTAQTIDKEYKLYSFLEETVPVTIPCSKPKDALHLRVSRYDVSRHDFIQDVLEGLKAAPMAVRLTPHILSVIDWSDPLNDPVRKQFLPLKSTIRPDHPKLEFDSLHETDDSPVPGVVHRYPDKVLFLATGVCPVYCRFCTRSYAVGASTESNEKQTQFRPGRKRWEPMFEYIEKNPAVQDVVVSGGDSFYLQPQQLELIGNRLLAVPHVRRIRFASKGLGVCPSRFLDNEDGWSDTLIQLSKHGRMVGKQVALHTHINHPNEMTWVTEQAARRLFAEGVIVRNQSVLLKGVNDTVGDMSALIRKLADCNIQPYYVYQGDLVKGVEDLRTPLSTILDLEKRIRGSIAGFMMPCFVVDLPGGGGKRLAASHESYDPKTGVSVFTAPGVKNDQVFRYYDPLP